MKRSLCMCFCHTETLLLSHSEPKMSILNTHTHQKRTLIKNEKRKRGWIREASPSTHTIQIIKIRHAKAITERSDFNQGVLGGRSPPSFNQNSSKIINKCEFSRNLIRKHQVTVNTRRGDPVCVPRFLKTDSEKSSGDTPRSIYIEFDSRWTAFEICCFGDMRVRP